MTDKVFEDPTVDVGDVEKYRLAFLMQFFVQHKRRFRFPRLRLQDLYQRVVKHPDPTAFCDLVARILRFLSHGDPDICIDSVDQALDRFAMEKRTSYRINMQRHRNGKPVQQLGPAARAALLDNLIESVYDEQPDFNFTTGFNPTSNGGSRSSNGASDQSNGDGNLFNDANDAFADFGDAEDVNVLIKAGQDAQGCSYYYMDDLRLYRERPQNGISSVWDVAVGPTAAQWQSFIASLSKNEKEHDLYCFLNQDLFELVKQSLDSYELHTPNNELDAVNLRTKEFNELTDLRRRKGTASSKSNLVITAPSQLALGSGPALTTNGPKSASPAFSGGHGSCGIGSLGSISSGAPLTPNSARTPTSAPPATASSGYHHQLLQNNRGPGDVAEGSTALKLEASNPRGDELDASSHDSSNNPLQDPAKVEYKSQGDESLASRESVVPGPCMNDRVNCAAQQSFAGQHLADSYDHANPNSCPSPAFLQSSASCDSTASAVGRLSNGGQTFGIYKQQLTTPGLDSRLQTSGQIREQSPSVVKCPSESAQLTDTNTSKQLDVVNTQQVVSKPQSLPLRPSQNITDSADNMKTGTARSVPLETNDPFDAHPPVGSKATLGPSTAFVPPMMTLSDGGSLLTQEQWENRKSKIAQLEKIHSTLSKSKSASTPGAVNTGAVFQPRVQQNGPLPPSLGGVAQPGYPEGGSGVPCQAVPELYGSNRSVVPPGAPPEMAQREWDRLCMDHHLDKTEHLTPRYHPSGPRVIGNDPSGCTSMAPELALSPMANNMMLPDVSCQRQGTDGPPVMMVPPNNSNFTMVGNAFPSTTNAPQHYRYPTPLNHQEQVSAMGTPGQKRAYYSHPSSDPWFSPYNTSQSPISDSAGYPISAYPGPRIGGMGSIPNVPTGPPSMLSNASAPVSNRTSVGKVSGKKRKTVSSSRMNTPTPSPTNQSTTVNSIQNYPCCKPSAGAPLTPNKPPYASPYVTDPIPSGYHPHRAAYMSAAQGGNPHMMQMCPNAHSNFSPMDPCYTQYPDPPGSAVLGRSLSGAGIPSERGRNLTPKGVEMFSVGQTGPCNPMSMGRVPSNCGAVFAGNGSLSQSYMHPSDVPGPTNDNIQNSRLAGSCTQHLTSASLASLARLSQLSGPEGPYVSSASLATIGSQMAPGATSHSLRPCHMDAPPSGLQHQAIRGHPCVKMHDVESGAVHAKFASQGYDSQSSIPTDNPAQLPVQGQSQSQQQAPSIQVNNTFFNAQLNVQQMNYQHLSAPGSTGQMQIHFVQQQQQQGSDVPPAGGSGLGGRPSRPSDSVFRMTAPTNGVTVSAADYYPGSMNPVAPAIRAPFYGNAALPGEALHKSDTPSNSAVPPASSAGYGNASIQITPRTPHTIQYLPTATAPTSEPLHCAQNYAAMDSSAGPRAKQARNNVHQYNFTESLDVPVMPDPTRSGTSVRSIPSGMIHSSNHVSAHQQMYQQQQRITSQQQHVTYSSQSDLNNRSAQQSSGSNWNNRCETRGADSSATTGVPYPESEIAAGNRMRSSARVVPSGPSFAPDSADAQWSSESVYRNPPQQYSRQQSMPTRPDFTQQSRIQRQQQYQQQSSQQHQMFMSTSVGNYPDGGQVQFMMSASSSSSLQASSNTSLLTNVGNVPPTMGSSESGPARPVNTNVSSDSKQDLHSDPSQGPPPKRVPPTYEDQKSTHAALSSAQVQGSSGRMPWPSINSGQYTGSYCHSSYSIPSGPTHTGSSASFYDVSVNNRELLEAQQPIMCDAPANMPQTFSSSVLP